MSILLLDGHERRAVRLDDVEMSNDSVAGRMALIIGNDVGKHVDL